MCPFAKFPFDNNQIEYVQLEEMSIPEYLEQIYRSCQNLHHSDQYSTCFVIFNATELTFDILLDLKAIVTTLLEESDLSGVYQLVPFHPQFRFEGIALESPVHQVNQSPFPMLHLLSEDDVSIAKESMHDPNQILEDNRITLDRLSK